VPTGKGGINDDVLPFKVDRGDAIADLKSFWGLATPTTIPDRCASCHKTELSWPTKCDIFAPHISEKNPQFFTIFAKLG